MDGKLERADLHYLGKLNRTRAFADSYSKVGGILDSTLDSWFYYYVIPINDKPVTINLNCLKKWLQKSKLTFSFLF